MFIYFICQGEEYQSDVLGNIHMKIAHLQQIALTLNKEIKYYLKEVFLREDKVIVYFLILFDYEMFKLKNIIMFH